MSTSLYSNLLCNLSTVDSRRKLAAALAIVIGRAGREEDEEGATTKTEHKVVSRAQAHMYPPVQVQLHHQIPRSRSTTG
jgi:hypothetical protein